MADRQMDFGFSPPPGAVREELAWLYEAVLALRFTGRRVYRAGAQHKVYGRLLSAAQLKKLYQEVMRHG